MKNKFDNFFMKIAIITSENSKSNRNKVGCIIVKNGNIISIGWNGTPHGFDNKCEDKNYNTIPEVIHAEENAICKLAKSTNSSQDSTLYITLSPCYNCAKLIIQSGIKRVVYLKEYRDIEPINFLRKANIICEKYN